MQRQPLRECLRHNKIYFEIVASLLIGCASLVVSWAALRINERILVATEISQMPHFSIGKRARFDQNVKAYVEETIFLSNNGAPVSNVNWNVKTFVVVDNNNAPPGKHILVPINGYYAAQFPTSAVTGELSSIVGVENNAKFSRIYRESLARNAGASVDKLVFIQETTISIVNYEDRFGRKGVTYFRDYSKVSEDSIRPLLQRKQEVPPLDIDNATFDDVLKRAAMPDALTISF